MEKIVVQGGTRLRGRVRVSGAKNAVLPLVAASLLASHGKTVIRDVPSLGDVRVIVRLLRSLGATVTHSAGQVSVQAGEIVSAEAPYELVRKMRASITVMGPLLAREGYARIPLPGGCRIGIGPSGGRPIDLHLKGLRALGASFHMEQGYVEGRVPHGRLRGATVYLDFPSVGATQNIMMAASLAEGRTVIKNAALEPEIIDLSNFINAMGARIRGAGTDEICIDGVRRLQGCDYTVIPDRIEAGTYMIAAAMTRGEVLVEGAIADHLSSLTVYLREMGVEVVDTETGVHVSAVGASLSPVEVKTAPYPGFSTDLQSQMMGLLLTVPGTSLLTENVFENRFMHVEELRRMGARIRVDGRVAVIEGGHPLSGTRVQATDLRAGATMVLAGLIAEGWTEVTGLHYIDRGYVNFAGNLCGLGSDVLRVAEHVNPASELLLQRQG